MFLKLLVDSWKPIHLEDRLLLRFALRYAVFYERTQHVFPHLLIRSVSTCDRSLGMSRIASDAFFPMSHPNEARLTL